jgi:precorrin-3B synthase
MSFARKGWCPGALRPMMSGDGLIVRVRAPGARLSLDALAALAGLAARFGSGVVELTSRGALQLRGVRPADHPALLDALAGLGLVDPAAERDPPAAATVSPFLGLEGDALGPRLLAALEAGIAARPALSALPPKFGFVLDAGPRPLLREVSGDLRLERAADGGLAVAPDGAAHGVAATPETAAAIALDLAERFAAHPLVARGEARRMAALAARVDLAPDLPRAALAAPEPPPPPGAHRLGALVGWPFGRLTAPTLAALAARAAAAGATEARGTPWRALLALGEAGALRDALGPLDLVLDAADRRRFVDACAGAPFCPSAEIETAALAAAAARALPPGARAHVSGCAKGCARPRPAALTLVGRAGRVDVVRDGAPGDAPTLAGLTPAEAAARLPALVGR